MLSVILLLPASAVFADPPPLSAPADSDTDTFVVQVLPPPRVVAVLLDAQGAWQPVAFGSTPHTLQDRIRAEPGALPYDAEDLGTRRRFEVRLHADDVDPDATPRAGLLTYQLQPETGPSGGSGVSAGVATRIRLGAWPEAYDGATAKLALDGRSLRRVDGARLGIDEVSELDRLPTFGPVRVSAEATGFLGASRSTVTTSATYLVAPWKEALVVLLPLLGLSWARRRFIR